MPQRQVKSLLTITVLLLSDTRLFQVEKVRFFSFACKTAVAWRKCILLVWYRVPCFLRCPVPKGDLPSAVAHWQPTAGKLLLLQGCSMSPERAVDLPYMQTSTLIFSVEVAAGVSMPLTEAVAISWWLWWRMPVCTRCVPFCRSWAKSSS